jgi:putative peptidoglycan lipid II flippase
MAIRLLGSVRPRLAQRSEPVRAVVRNFGPVFVGRGVVQISAYIDTVIASLLPTGAVAAVAYAQVLYTLPVSLFGMSVSAAELPAMSGATGKDEDRAAFLRARLAGGLRQIAFFVIPSAVAFLALGDVVAATLYQSGEFTRNTALYVWGILAGAAVGLLPSTLGRLYASTYYALHDTRTPLRFATIRVALTIALGLLFAIWLPPVLGLDRRWGAAGLTLAGGVAGWIEFLLLRRSLNHRIGVTGLPAAFVIRLWGSALVAATAGWLVKTAWPAGHPLLVGLFSLGVYGIVYFALVVAFRLPEAVALVDRARRRRRPTSP